jgi:hypothetical protein
MQTLKKLKAKGPSSGRALARQILQKTTTKKLALFRSLDK